MRKIIIITLALVLVSMTYAFAIEVTSYAPLNFQASSNVKVFAKSAPQTYAAISGHLNGDRIFGASSNETVLRYKSKNTGEHITSSDLTASDSSAFSGWSSL